MGPHTPAARRPPGPSSITWALAAISFVYFIFYGIKVKGLGGYLKSFAPSGLPVVMVPIVWFLELFSTVLRVLTLAVRLYGNMFAGHMVLGIFALASSVFLTCGIQALDPISGVLSLPLVPAAHRHDRSAASSKVPEHSAWSWTA